MAEAETSQKLNFKKILPIFVIVMVDLLGLTIIIPLLPLYATSFGATPFVIGLLGAAYPIMQVIGAPILGRLSDRYGRRPVLLISQLGTFLGFLVLGFANILWVIFLSRIIDGISGANIATAQAAISDSTTAENRTQGLGLIGAAFGLGFIIGPIITFVALLVSDNNYQLPAFIAAAFSFGSILLTFFWFDETLPEEQRGANQSKKSRSVVATYRAALQHPAVGLLLVLIFFQQMAFGGFENLIALFTLTRLGLNGSGNAILFVFVGIIIVAVQGGLIGRWSRRFGDRKLVYVGFALLAVGLLATGLTPKQPVPWYSEEELRLELQSPDEGGRHSAGGELAIELPSDENNSWLGIGWILIAMIPVSIGGGILMPAINSLVTKRVDENEVGEILGVSTAFLSGANALAPIIGGGLFQLLGGTMTFVVWSVTMGTLCGLALTRVKPGREEEVAAGLVRGRGH